MNANVKPEVRQRGGKRTLPATNADLLEIFLKAKGQDLFATTQPAVTVGWDCPECHEQNLKEARKCTNCGRINCCD